MAEAASSFYCHKCTQQIHPLLPEYICPWCQCGYIEEFARGSSWNISEKFEEYFDTVSQCLELCNIADALRSAFPRNRGSGAQDDQHSIIRSSALLSGPSSSRRHHRPGSRPVTRRQASREIEGWGQRTEGFLQQHIATIAEGRRIVTHPGFRVLPTLHNNLGDYAWERDGFDAVTTQLLNQLDGTGQPPLSKNKIEKIPSVLISQDQVDKNLQCTVCMEDFIPGESVKKLSCEHHFHRDCIIPWLELHGTCPVCRKLLNDDHLPLSQSSSSHSNNSSESSSNENGSQRSSANHSNSSLNYTHPSPSVYDFFTDEFVFLDFPF